MTLRASGLLKEDELLGVQKKMAAVISKQKKARILVLVEDFEGWDPNGTWNDFSFQDKLDPSIEKMAIVGDKKWQDLALMFSAQGLRGFPIEYFVPADLGKAQAWLET
jgi:hypothetical protein